MESGMPSRTELAFFVVSTRSGWLVRADVYVYGPYPSALAPLEVGVRLWSGRQRWPRRVSRAISAFLSFRLHEAVPAPMLKRAKMLWVIRVPVPVLGLGLSPQCI